MPYIDAFVLPIPKKNLATYRRVAKLAGKVWREHGALEYRECIADDLKPGAGLPFPKMMKIKPGETIAFSWIMYRSRAHRDRVNKKVMSDPRMAKMPDLMPFDVNRMAWGGFKVLVEA
jgi:uncharacterized protein YbaA (DUF1428 family)